MPNRQAEFAQWFADEANACGHDDFHALDVLDILGTLGLALIPDETAQADDSYLDAVSRFAHGDA